MEDKIICKSQVMKAVVEKLNRFAPLQTPILLVGETGTGKNLFARQLHQLSPRRTGAFVVVDGAALNDNLLESELFGYEKGAFTGAVATKIGRVEMANNGTLFLNEVQNLSLGTQAKLLEIVESGTFYRVGGRQEIQSRFRLIAATNQDMDELMAAGRIRKDFYYRIHRTIIEIPPLRERREDILPLAEHYLQMYGNEMGKRVCLSPAAKELLMTYPWPGNVRELMSVIQEAIGLCETSELQPQDFSLRIRREVIISGGKQNGLSLEEIERRYIAAVLEVTNGNIMHACKILGIDRHTLLRKMRKYELSR